MLNDADAAGRPFDLLVTDMQMPEMDGYTLAKTLRASGNRIPIVALTAHAMAEERQKCLDSGCDAHATKPINRATLIATCAHWIDNSRDDSVVTQSTADNADVESDLNSGQGTPLLSEFADDPKMGPLIVSFLNKLEPKVEQMSGYLIDNRLDELARLAHQLTGSGGGYGFPSISDAARHLETRATSDCKVEQIQQAVSELSSLCRQAIAAGTTADRASIEPVAMDGAS